MDAVECLHEVDEVYDDIFSVRQALLYDIS